MCVREIMRTSSLHCIDFEKQILLGDLNQRRESKKDIKRGL